MCLAMAQAAPLPRCTARLAPALADPVERPARTGPGADHRRNSAATGSPMRTLLRARDAGEGTQCLNLVGWKVRFVGDPHGAVFERMYRVLILNRCAVKAAVL